MAGFLSEVVRGVRAELRSESYGRDLPTDVPQERPSLRSAIERKSEDEIEGISREIEDIVFYLEDQ